MKIKNFFLGHLFMIGLSFMLVGPFSFFITINQAMFFLGMAYFMSIAIPFFTSFKKDKSFKSMLVASFGITFLMLLVTLGISAALGFQVLMLILFFLINISFMTFIYVLLSAKLLESVEKTS